MMRNFLIISMIVTMILIEFVRGIHQLPLEVRSLIAHYVSPFDWYSLAKSNGRLKNAIQYCNTEIRPGCKIKLADDEEIIIQDPNYLSLSPNSCRLVGYPNPRAFPVHYTGKLTLNNLHQKELNENCLDKDSHSICTTSGLVFFTTKMNGVPNEVLNINTKKRNLIKLPGSTKAVFASESLYAVPKKTKDGMKLELNQINDRSSCDIRTNLVPIEDDSVYALRKDQDGSLKTLVLDRTDDESVLSLSTYDFHTGDKIGETEQIIVPFKDDTSLKIEFSNDGSLLIVNGYEHMEQGNDLVRFLVYDTRTLFFKINHRSEGHISKWKISTNSQNIALSHCDSSLNNNRLMILDLNREIFLDTGLVGWDYTWISENLLLCRTEQENERLFQVRSVEQFGQVISEGEQGREKPSYDELVDFTTVPIGRATIIDDNLLTWKQDIVELTWETID